MAARYPRRQDIIHDSNVRETARPPKQQDTQDSKTLKTARYPREQYTPESKIRENEAMVGRSAQKGALMEAWLGRIEKMKHRAQT